MFHSQTKMELPDSDDRTYKHIALSKPGKSSKLNVLLISDPNTDKASAACDVNVGQLNDPPDYPGLAHFAEHMVFIGNKKYPTENAYDNYLSSHGGSCNAFTDLDHTCYYFDVQLGGDDNDDEGEGENTEGKAEGGEESKDIDEVKESENRGEEMSTFEGALDRFAHCLIDPLFTASAVAREVQAVDSEHSKNMQQDMWRSYQLSRTLLAPEHPYASFGTGSAKSLHAPEISVPPEEDGNKDESVSEMENKKKDSKNVELSVESSELRNALISFFHKYYRKSLSLYKLVVLCDKPIEQMEEMVRRIFNHLVEKSFADDDDGGASSNDEDGVNNVSDLDSYRPTKILKELFPTLLDQVKVPQRVHIVPVSQTHTLELQFPMREQQTLYRSKPSNYLSHLIGHEGAGSLLSALKEKHYAQDLYADGSSRPSITWSSFTIHIDLTELGLKNSFEVIQMIFSYLDVVRSTGHPIEWIQEELTVVSDLRFKFLSKRQPMDYTCSVSGWMQHYPPQHYISGAYKVYDYSPDAIVDCWGYLRPDNMLVLLSSPLFDPALADEKGRDGARASDDFRTDPNYGTQYKLYPVTGDEMKQWASAKAADYPSLHLPEQNDMIATEFGIIESGDNWPKDRPQCIEDSDVLRLWYKPDNVFKMPKVNILFLLRTNHAYLHSSESYILTQLWASVLQEKCNEFTYLASMAGLHCDIAAETAGIELTVSGYSHKAHILLDRIMDAVAETPEDGKSWVSTELFDRLYDKLSKRFAAFLVAQPYQHAIHAVDSCLESIHWTIHDKIAALKKVTRDDLIHFATSKALWKQCKLEGFVHGNVTANDAKKMSLIILKKLNLTREAHPLESRIISLSPGSAVLSSPSPAYKYQLAEYNVSDLNSCVEMLFQIGPVDYPTNAVLAIVAHLIREPAYNQLRTEEQLGYIVHSAIKTNSSHIKALLILVQSQSHDAVHVEGRIEAFLGQFRKKIVEMDNEEYQKNVEGVVAGFLEKNKNLGEETYKYWHVISNQTYAFARLKAIAEYAKSTTKLQVLRFFDRFIAKSSPFRRKLCIQVFAKQHQDKMGKGVDDADVFIDNSADFKRCMPLFPLAPRTSVDKVDTSECNVP